MDPTPRPMPVDPPRPMPVDPPMPVPVDPTPDAKTPWWRRKWALVLGGVVVLVIIVAALDSGDDDTPATAGASQADSDRAAAAQKGTRANPFRYGEAHSRSAGLLGAAWTVSIDEVREIPFDSYRADDPALVGKQCLAVLGSARLDELDSDDLTSNMFSFPSVTFVDSRGVELDSATECDESELTDAGYLRVFDMSLTEGASAKWVTAYIVDEHTVPQVVAIENTVYAP